MTNEIHVVAPYPITRKWAIVTMLCLSPIFILSICVGHIKEGLGTWICSGILLAAARTRWDLRNRSWYWIILVLSIPLQIPFVLLVPWDDRHWSYVTLIPVAVLDYSIVYASFKLVDRLARKDAATKVEN
jgi:hypothetical protein